MLKRPLIRTLAAGVGAAVLLLCPASVASANVGGIPAGDTSNFKGVNWADPRDNYASDEVVPSGLSKTDDYRTVYRRIRSLDPCARIAGPNFASYRSADMRTFMQFARDNGVLPDVTVGVFEDPEGHVIGLVEAKAAQ